MQASGILLTGQRDAGVLLIIPSAADVCMAPCEPHLLQVGDCVALEALPQSRSEGGSGLVHGEGLEGILDLAADLGVGEFPCERELA